jgi:hypothetical protein
MRRSLAEKTEIEFVGRKGEELSGFRRGDGFLGRLRTAQLAQCASYSAQNDSEWVSGRR